MMTEKTTIIIPQQKHGFIAEAVNGKINILGKIDIPYNSISKIIDNETIVTLDKESKQLLLHNMEGNLVQAIKVPFGIAMNTKEKIVYIGGNARSGEVCYMVDLEAETQTLKNITLPVEMGWGKAVDDILIVGDKMLLIDDLVFPKYSFEYDISISNKPVWIKTIELPDDRPYEHIVKGDMNENWMIYLSTSSSGWSGDEAHITIEGKQQITLSSSKKNSIVDICLIGDTLYTLTDIGLGYFDLNEGELHAGNIRFIEHKIVGDRIIKVDDTHLLLTSKYEYELLDLANLHFFNGGKEERFWSYGSLDLSGRGLTEFPEEKIKNLEALVYLNLSDNPIKKIPKALKRCKQLRWLGLSQTGIRRVPFWLRKLEKLDHLDLSDTYLGILSPFAGTLTRFPKNIRYLDLEGCMFFSFPSSITGLKKLEYLNLKDNLVFRIPWGIGKLKRLRTLEMNWAVVLSSPKRIGELPIESIKIDGGFRGKMPKVIYKLKNLKQIEASKAGIDQISGEISNLIKLESLDLEECKLEKLPDDIIHLQQLKKLNLRNNRLCSLPENFFEKLINLEMLVLSGNQFKEIPKEIKHLKKLRILAVGRNKLAKCPDELCELQNLKELYLNDNHINELPQCIVGLKALMSIHVDTKRLNLTDVQKHWLDNKIGK